MSHDARRARGAKVVGCQRQYADNAANPVVHQAMAEERAVTAIVLDHEQADKKARSGTASNK